MRDGSPFFVAGITGHVGGAAARRLLEGGHAVRTLARDPQKAAAWAAQGVDVRPGDLNDAAVVAAALEGVAGAFLLIPPLMLPSPGYPEAKAVIAAYREALRQSPPPRLALLSSFGSEKTSGIGNITSTHLMEEALGDLPFPTAFVRAGSFMENDLFGFGKAAESGWYDTFFSPTDRPVSMIATVDIGHEVARLLADGWSGKRIVEIGLPVTPDEVARAMGEALGREVKARSIPRDRWTAALEGMGLPPGRTGMYEEMMDGCNSGWISFGTPGAESVPGTLTPAQFFAGVGKGG